MKLLRGSVDIHIGKQFGIHCSIAQKILKFLGNSNMFMAFQAS